VSTDLALEVAKASGIGAKTWALQVAVIPAKAGIHPTNLRESAVDGLDSRFRGNDCFGRDTLPNDTNTRSALSGPKGGAIVYNGHSSRRTARFCEP
jgi:hypothetical protein